MRKDLKVTIYFNHCDSVVDHWYMRIISREYYLCAKTNNDEQATQHAAAMTIENKSEDQTSPLYIFLHLVW
ncbi:MAG: hypothetical protein ACLSCV_01960 [Acutalibacteraceae bacterium]